MYEFHAHNRYLADLETAVRDARQRNASFPKPSMWVISVLAVLLIAGTFVGANVI